MKENILEKLMATCPFQEVFEDMEEQKGSCLPVPRLKIGHIRADHDGFRWYNTVWPCHKQLATPEICREIDDVYERLTASDALKDLPTLRKFCNSHMEACIEKEHHDEFGFFYVGKSCDFWVRLVTRKDDYNLYLNAYAKGDGRRKYFDFLEKLRQSGETNMYEATPYLQREFEELRSPQKAAEILTAWFATFRDKEEREG